MQTDRSSNHLSNTPRDALPTSTALIRAMIYVLVLGIIMGLCAGRLDWWPGWAFLAVYLLSLVVTTLAFRFETELTEERSQLKAGVKTWDKVLSTLMSLFAPIGCALIAALDERFGGSPEFAPALQIGALVVLFVANVFAYWAMATNRYFSRYVRIQTERGHTVVSDGPYRIVRHPGYIGAITLGLATAVALGSVWSLVTAIGVAVIAILRTVLEDRTLQAELPGYREYAQRVRYRLIPGLW